MFEWSVLLRSLLLRILSLDRGGGDGCHRRHLRGESVGSCFLAVHGVHGEVANWVCDHAKSVVCSGSALLFPARRP